MCQINMYVRIEMPCERADVLLTGCACCDVCVHLDLICLHVKYRQSCHLFSRLRSYGEPSCDSASPAVNT
jgi:hypothetical protein